MGRKLGLKSMVWTIDKHLKEEINIWPEQNEETRVQKIRLQNLWDNFKCSNIRIIWVPEGEEEDQEIENLSENIMKENFPNLLKEIRLPRSPGSSESSREVGPKEEHAKAHHNYITHD